MVEIGLDELARRGAQRMPQLALEAEVTCFIESHGDIVDEKGRRMVVRNGYLPKREIVTGSGPLEVKQPRARDLRGKSDPESVTFTSAILPRYLRRSKKIDELLPWLYLRGISTGQMQEALACLLGEDAAGLSATAVSRFTKSWVDDHEAWSKRDLSDREYVGQRADGIDFNIRLEDERQCILVLMGATRDGKKEIIGILDGYRENEQSWYELLVDIKHRGLTSVPKIAVGDGALGFWAAETKNEADKAFDLFVRKYGAKYPKAVACLAMIFKLAKVAENNWRRLNRHQQIMKLVAGYKLVDGIVQERDAA